jgi:hypothetical protein
MSEYQHAERFEALANHQPATKQESARNEFRRAMGMPTIGSPENVAMIIAAALDQLMADARQARLDVLYQKLDIAFQQAVEDLKEQAEEECSSQQ